MPIDSYAERLADALGVPADKASWAQEHRAKVHSLAGHVGITYQAIVKYFDAGSKAMSAPNNSRAARRLRVSSDWLATGEGPRESAAAGLDDSAAAGFALDLATLFRAAAASLSGPEIGRLFHELEVRIEAGPEAPATEAAQSADRAHGSTKELQAGQRKSGAHARGA